MLRICRHSSINVKQYLKSIFFNNFDANYECFARTTARFLAQLSNCEIFEGKEAAPPPVRYTYVYSQ